eukprot:ctg_1367.g441
MSGGRHGVRWRCSEAGRYTGAQEACPPPMATPTQVSTPKLVYHSATTGYLTLTAPPLPRSAPLSCAHAYALSSRDGHVRLHHIVVVVGLRENVVRVALQAGDVLTRRHIGDIDPLTRQRVIVDI